MALVRWEPFREIETLQRQMNRLFDEIVPTSRTAEEGIAFIPPAEIQETPDAIHLKVEIPGLDRNDLDVHVSPEAVSISGDRKSEIKTEEKGITRTEFRYGRFQRVIPLPARVQHDQVQAEYKDGILKLRLPKAEEHRNKVVKVNLGDGHRGNGQRQ
ncbi:Hsp20/alpha crystallin family protein [Nostocaceae cyanobacterium CENA369]|uniref:Hsp20/alpha crystallin family protein n=1 Tax=Dendronalium phyllosphericum CENA369 TaxID=1725256 RepID=A0A8J7HZK8_9NOST|nr:Hsp20/alpha crystallin family protein [Dendronalium phyllosphericum]MBH8573225.1 Hsp20/alpha crystallin family protein [Dendronalium phyllosphericum CENA369]